MRSTMAKPKVRKSAPKSGAKDGNPASNGHLPHPPGLPGAAANGELISASSLPAIPGQADPSKTITPLELAEKVKELVRLAQEQGYLTYNDINDVLPENIATPEDLDEILIKLRNLEVEI